MLKLSWLRPHIWSLWPQATPLFGPALRGVFSFVLSAPTARIYRWK
jgi:hypothetical protein